MLDGDCVDVWRELVGGGEFAVGGWMECEELQRWFWSECCGLVVDWGSGQLRCVVGGGVGTWFLLLLP